MKKVCVVLLLVVSFVLSQNTCGVPSNTQSIFSTDLKFGPFPDPTCSSQIVVMSQGWYAPNGDNIQSYVMSPESFAVYNSTGTIPSYYSEISSPNTSTTCFSASNKALNASQVYLVYICKNLIQSCSINHFNAQSCSSPTSSPTPTSAPTTTPTTSPSTNPSGGVNWAGSYNVNAGCDTTTCCCLSGTLTVSQSGLDITINGPVTGQCGGSSSTTIQFSLSSTSSNSAVFTFGSDSFRATKNGNTVQVENLSSSKCSGSATCVSGSCKSFGVVMVPSLMILLSILFIFV